MQHDFISATVLLLLVFDPFGSIPVFSSALRQSRRRGARAWCCANA